MALSTNFESGFRLHDGDALNRAFGYPSYSYESGIVATPAGTVATSIAITEAVSQIDTVASGADGVLLPAASPGKMFILINAGANSMQVFAAGGSTINGTAGSTGVAHANGITAMYVCAKAGDWRRILSA